MQTSSLQPGALLKGRYRILEKLGGGGYGVVYKARDEGWANRLVAIKQIIMPRTLSAQEKIEITDTYNREVTLLSELRHKSLPEMYDHFTDPECWYTVMQYIEGKTLEEHLQTVENGRLCVEDVFLISIKLCTVLDYLHRQKPPVIFRDVKPENIMLTIEGDIYLIDFGTARRYRVGQHDTGALGTPGYAAPEQYGDAQTEPRTDVYGLGATLQTLLTGISPLEVRMSGLPPAVDIPQGVRSLLEWMMEANLEERPKSIASVRWYLNFLGSNPDALNDRDDLITSKRLAMKGVVLPKKPAHRPAQSLAPLQSPAVTNQPAQSLAPLQPQIPIQPAPIWKPPAAGPPPLQSFMKQSQVQLQMQQSTARQSQASLQRSTSKGAVPTFFLWDNIGDITDWIRIGIYVITVLCAILLVFREASAHTLSFGFWISLNLGIYLAMVVIAPVVSYLMSVLLILCWGLLRCLFWVLNRIIRLIIGL